MAAAAAGSELDVEVLPAAAALGAPLVATYTIRNNGPVAERNVTLTTTITPGGTVTATGPPPGCAADGGGCTVAGLAPAESVTYPVTLTYPTALTGSAAGTVTGDTRDGADPVPGNNTDSADFTVADGSPT